MNRDVVVSVYCLAFNHEKYIRKTLDGFVNQQTSFSYEVIVHDDASTDGTAAVIEEYATKYPDIIIPILQKENQHSQKIPIIKTYIANRCKGKYIAICEGDDYWFDNGKLQKQVEALEKHNNCSFCIHKVRVVDENDAPAGYSFPAVNISTGILSSSQFLSHCKGYSFQTSSYMMRRDAWHKYVMNYPSFRKYAPVGDIPLQLYFGQLASVYYINEEMSCYRRGVPTSATVRQAKANISKKIEYAKRMRIMFEHFDEYTSKKYHDVCLYRISRYMATECILSEKSIELIKQHEIFNSLNPSRKLFLLFSCIFPVKGRKMYERRLFELGKQKRVT